MLYRLQCEGASLCVAGNIEFLPFMEDSIDFVICSDVIHHLSNKIPNLLLSFKRILKPGGFFFLGDVNAWGMFQFLKSKLLPKPLYWFLRSTYHLIKQSDHRPANYEFPTDVWVTQKLFSSLDFVETKIYPTNLYHCISPSKFQIYKFISKIEWVKKYHNYHYRLSATKGF